MTEEMTVNVEGVEEKWTYTHEQVPKTGRPVLVARMRNGEVVSRGFDHHDGAEWVGTHPCDTVYAWRDVETPEIPEGISFSGQRAHT